LEGGDLTASPILEWDMDITWLIDFIKARAKEYKYRKEMEGKHDFRPPVEPGPDIVFSWAYGAWYDIETGHWLTEKCGDPDCKYCKDRPERVEWTKNRERQS